MRIAQVAPLTLPVPPAGSGGTQRIVSYLTEALVGLGHEVTLFAHPDSVTSARLVTPAPAFAPAGPLHNLWAHYHLLFERLYRRADTFDIIHFHIGYRHFPILRRHPLPHLTSPRWSLDVPELQPLFREYREMPLLALSDAQREPLPHANWVGTVHNGLPVDLYRPGPGRGGYLAFLGRITPVKGADDAIRIARRSGMRLVLAGPVDDRVYFEQQIRPHLRDGAVDYIGAVDDRRKQALLGDARALLFPIRWREPFGIVMIEALACGTPVVGYRRGAVAEVIEEGVTGFVVRDVGTAAAAVERVSGLRRAACRRVFEARFSARRMAEGCLAVYRRLAGPTARP